MSKPNHRQKSRKVVNKSSDLDRLVKVLVDSWKGSLTVNDFDSVIRNLSESPYGDKAVEKAVISLPDEEKVDFISDCLDSASVARGKGTYPESKEPFGIRLQVFSLILNGFSNDIEALLNDRTKFQELVSLVRKSGFAADKSNVSLIPIAIHPMQAVGVSIRKIRKLAKEVSCLTVHQLPSVPKVLSILGFDEAEFEKDAIITCSLIGMHFRPSSEQDSFYLPAEIEGDLEEKMSVEFEMRDKFLVMANDFMVSNDLDVVVDGPFCWSEGLSEIAINHLQGVFHALAFQEGFKELDTVDSIHLANNNEDIVVVLQKDSKLLGPVEIPNSLLSFGADSLFDWFTEIATQVEHHDSLDELKSLLLGGSKVN